MKPYKYLCMVLVLLTAILTVGCDSKDTAQNPTFFALKQNPSFAVEIKSDVSAYNRVNPEYTSKLTPSGNNGILVPFVGGYNTYVDVENDKTSTVKRAVWGLCDQNGTIIVDAVYDAVKKHMTDEGSFVYELIIGSDGSDTKKGERYLASGDGKWIFKIPNNCVFRSVGAERAVFERTVESGKNIYTYLDFYDFSGRRKFIFDKSLAEAENTSYTVGAFSGGLAPVNVTVTDTKTNKKTKSAYYIDNTGKAVYKNFEVCGEFENGYAIVYDVTGYYGVINLKGEWIFKAEYDYISINHEKGYYVIAKDGVVSILNNDKKTVKTINSQKGHIDVLNSETPIYKKTNADTGRVEYFYMDTDNPFTCADTGMFPDSGESVGGLYVCTYGGTGTVFNEAGETITAIGDFGELLHRFGNNAVAISENGRKVCIVTVSSKQRTEWMKYTYTRENIGDRYIVLYDYENDTYGLYDLLLSEFRFIGCDYISVSDFGTGKLLSVFNKGAGCIYDGNLSLKLKTVSVEKH